MAAHDFASAERALAHLEREGDASTRLKSKLGRAELALGRGDCASAERLVAEILREPGASQALQTRAARLIAGCSEPEARAPATLPKDPALEALP